MSKSIFSGFFSIIFFVYAQSQQVNLTEIEAFAKTDKYEQLLQRYLSFDTTLTLEEYRLLYYGQAFRDGYSGYSDGAAALYRELRNCYKKLSENTCTYEHMALLGESILRESPFHLSAIVMMANASYALKQYDASLKWLKHYQNIINVILSSGDGKSFNTAFLVARISDEYLLLSYLELEPQKQELHYHDGKPYDVFVTKKENGTGKTRVYFDISLFFGKF